MDAVPLAVLISAALEWRSGDPDPRTRRELDALLERVTGDESGSSAAWQELADRFAGPLQFGTAGLRGALGAGPNRMNRAVVIRAASGIGSYLAARMDQPTVVVGFDARTDSDVFARDTCAVLVAAGASVRLLPGPLPTPVLAYSVRADGADAGVMVTASHNPAQDNGYKVYLGGRAAPPEGRGVQIVPPADEDIAAAIEAAPPAVAVPMATSGWEQVPTSVLDDYLEAVLGAVRRVVPDGPRADLAIVVTPLHGVGGDLCRRALVAAGFRNPYLVPEQAEPDAAFPTVAFPNPEEPGALDAALAAGRARDADLVIANDPDADRCAVAVPDLRAEGGWRALTGDEVGSLLGDVVLACGARAGGDGASDGVPVAASTIVSSQMLARIAAARGARHVETLTGFKWLSRVPGVVYAYEEALGYCVAPQVVRDKDGISAAVLVADTAARLAAQGRTLLDALDDLARAHGVHATDQLSIRESDPDRLAERMERLRREPPSTLGDEPVLRVEDLDRGAGGLPPTPGVRMRIAGGARVVVRPSGTEPKLKCYLEVVVDVATAGDLGRAREQAAGHLAAIRRDLAELLT